MPHERVYLTVPFAEKDKVKSLGARWDKERKAWFAMADQSRAFEAWIDKKERGEPAPVASAMREPGDKRSEIAQVLEVPFGDKDDAKALGARWDRALRAWYVPAGIELAPFEAWLPGKQKAPDPIAGVR